jgi:hypothetical protein
MAIERQLGPARETFTKGVRGDLKISYCGQRRNIDSRDVGKQAMYIGSGPDSKCLHVFCTPCCRASGKFVGRVQVWRTKNSVQGRHFLQTSLSTCNVALDFFFIITYNSARSSSTPICVLSPYIHCWYAGTVKHHQKNSHTYHQETGQAPMFSPF